MSTEFTISRLAVTPAMPTPTNTPARHAGSRLCTKYIGTSESPSHVSAMRQHLSVPSRLIRRYQRYIEGMALTNTAAERNVALLSGSCSAYLM